MEAVVRLEGAVQYTLNKLIELGYFKTKNEAIRAGLLVLGKEYGVKFNAQEIEDMLALKKMEEIDVEVKRGKRRMVSLDSVLKKNNLKRSGL